MSIKKFNIKVNGKNYNVEVEEIGGVASAPTASAPVASAPTASAPVSSAPVASAPVASTPTGGGAGGITAPMPGNIIEINVKVGDTVATGDIILVLEAMKMKNNITAPSGGTVQAVNIKAGDTVATGEVLVSIG